MTLKAWRRGVVQSLLLNRATPFIDPFVSPKPKHYLVPMDRTCSPAGQPNAAVAHDHAATLLTTTPAWFIGGWRTKLATAILYEDATSATSMVDFLEEKKAQHENAVWAKEPWQGKNHSKQQDHEYQTRVCRSKFALKPQSVRISGCLVAPHARVLPLISVP